MAPDIALAGGAFLLNAVLGVVLVVGLFSAMERRVSLGVGGSVVIAAGLIGAEAVLGEQLLTVSVSEMKLLVVAAALGGILGVVGTVVTVEPDL